MALVNLETYYSFPNLSDENNVFRYSPGFIEVGRGDEDDSTPQRQWVEVQISEGSYHLIDIAETIKIAMKRNGHSDESIEITANNNTLKSVLEMQDDFRADFRARNSISNVLGFRNQVHEEGIHESDSVVNILSINSILVNVDVIGGSYVNGRTQNKIYSCYRQVCLLLQASLPVTTYYCTENKLAEISSSLRQQEQIQKYYSQSKLIIKSADLTDNGCPRTLTSSHPSDNVIKTPAEVTRQAAEIT